ncbi:MAG: dihydrolipoyl dehydrogenase, partial [Pseudomonadota bacterium]
WGCIPSKVMKTTADLVGKFKRAGEFGIAVDGSVQVDMEALMARKETVVENQAKGILKLFDHHKIRYLRGTGTIERMHLSVVKLENGGIVEVPWDKLILALGSRPLDLEAFPFDGKNILSSNDALVLREIPKSLLIVGGGVIGCEFAFIFSSLGSRVTVVEAMNRLLPLPWVDEDSSKVIQREMKKHKIELLVNRTVNKVEEDIEGCRITVGPSAFAVEIKERERRPLTLVAEKVLLCIGRKANTDNVGLEKIGVRTDDKGWIAADEAMQTSVQHVYAIGDVLGPSKVMLAHVASSEGLVAVENAVGGKAEMDYHVVPSVIFSSPEVADVGFTEKQAREQGYCVRSDSVLFRQLGKPHVLGEIAGEAKIVSEAETGKILGVHIVGPGAGDLIAEGTLAMKLGCTVKDLAATIHAHPTLPEIMMEASFKALGRPIHG